MLRLRCILLILSWITLVFNYVLNDVTEKTECIQDVNEKQGRIRLDRTGRCRTEMVYHLMSNHSQLFMDVDINSPHASRKCSHVIYYVTTPDGVKHCFKENFCQNFYLNDTEGSKNLSEPIGSSDDEKCKHTWIAEENWPPTVKITNQAGQQFNADIYFRFVPSKEKTSRSASHHHDHEIEQTKISTHQPQNLTGLAIAFGALAGVGFALGILWYHKKRRSGNETNGIDRHISPYAVSVRRRSENAFAASITFPPVENPYDEPTEEMQESVYLRPMEEGPYYEIDANGRSQIINPDCGVYNETESVGILENDRTFHTFQPDHALFASSENVYYNSEAILTQDLPTCSRSMGDLTGGNDFANVSYGEIMGTLSVDGALERFEACKDTYKSVRKHKT